jgi:hypothetical protein
MTSRPAVRDSYFTQSVGEKVAATGVGNGGIDVGNDLSLSLVHRRPRQTIKVTVFPRRAELL